MDKTVITEENLKDLPQIFEKEFLQTLKDRFDRDFIIEKYIILNGTPNVQVILVTDDSDKIRFSAYITPEMTIFDDFQRACCYHQLRQFIDMLIPGAFINISFLEDFRPDPELYVTYDEYITKHNVNRVLIRILSCKDVVTPELLETVYNVLFQKLDVEVGFFLYEYDDNDSFTNAVNTLKNYHMLTKNDIEKTGPASFTSTFFPGKGDN